jgi:ketosteroid isomerase-like protein
MRNGPNSKRNLSEVFPKSFLTFTGLTGSIERNYPDKGDNQMPGDIEQEILTQEEKLTQAQRQLDVSALDRIFADDLMLTGVTGEVCGKAGVMSEVRQGILQRDNAIAQGKKITASFDKEDIKVVTHGDTAVTSYRFVIRMQGEGVDVHRRYRRTNVWLKRENAWQIIAGQMSSLDPQGSR